MKIQKITEKEFRYIEKTVKDIQAFYLILIGYIVMLSYLHWLDLRDGTYDWAYWPAIGFTVSMIWFAFVLLPGKFKDILIRKELRKQKNKDNGTET
ncbi:2TM domain-containing protein [Moheibacter sp.]|uniref:2TM domain-containing protein n=1 Tax=Moheibacter sp. TaxID=1965316 RepID=UPI003C710269